MARSLWQNRRCNPTGLIAAALLLCLGTVHGAGLGGLAGAHLRSPVGADAFAKGGANSASPDYLRTWWNPAYLANLRNSQLSLGGEYRSLGRAGGALGYEFHLPPRVGLGVAVVYRGDHKLDGLRDEIEEVLEDGSFTTISAKIGLAYFINRTVSAGLNVGVSYKKMPTDWTTAGKLTYSSSGSVGGFDAAVRFMPTKNLDVALIVRNILRGQSWEVNPGKSLNVTIPDTLPMGFVAATRLKAEIFEKPFIWTCDLTGYLLDGAFTPLDHAVAVLNNGLEWHGWEKLHVRAGIRDITLNRDLVRNTSDYAETFSLAVTAGIRLDLSSLIDGLSANIGLSTDKVMAGPEEYIDFVLTF